MFAYDGPDISSFQPIGDWPAVARAGCRFGACRATHGPYTQWDRASSAPVVRPAFVDPHAVDNLVGMRAAGLRWRVLYVVVTPLESAASAAARVMRFVEQVGGLQAGELIALDYEGNPARDPDGNYIAGDEWCSPEWVEECRVLLANVYGPARIGAYSYADFLARLDLTVFGWRWLARYALDALDYGARIGAEVVQWTSSAVIDGIAAGRVDMNEVRDAAALDAAAQAKEAAVGNPTGSLDVVEDLGGGRVRVQGWAYDPDVPDEPIDVHVYLGGQLAGATRADRERLDLASVGVSPNHGFDAVFTFSLPVQVDAYGINVGDGSNAHLGGRQAGLMLPAPERGPEGPAGPQGPQGPQGPAGAPGGWSVIGGGSGGVSGSGSIIVGQGGNGGSGVSIVDPVVELPAPPPPPFDADDVAAGITVLNRVLDRDIGASLRAATGVALGVSTGALAVLQTATTALDSLPRWQWVGSVAAWAQAGIMFLGRFTSIGNVVKEGATR